jgi:Adenylate and Guanylate cyclase catalytic domain
VRFEMTLSLRIELTLPFFYFLPQSKLLATATSQSAGCPVSQDITKLFDMDLTCLVANLVALTPCTLDKRDNHSIVMARFAASCLEKFRAVVNMLEDDLPGAASLDLRTGLHSGAVTAGVLRGDRARFQLFGDTGMISPPLAIQWH